MDGTSDRGLGARDLFPLGGKPLRKDQNRFEVVVYNRIVRKLVERNESHKDLKDDWAENHYQEVQAVDADEARRKVEIRYPADKGFVIDKVIAMPVYDED